MICRRAVQNLKRRPWYSCNTQRYRSSGAYFILIPEVPNDTRETNPILRHDEFPTYSELNSKSCIRGCAKLALEFDHTFDTLVEEVSDLKKEVTFDEVFRTIEASLAPLSYAEQTVNILMIQDHIKFPRSMGARIQSQIHRSIADRFNEKTFYNRLKELNANRDNLTEAQQRLLDFYLLECRRAGADLPDKKFKLLQENIASQRMEEEEYLQKSSSTKAQFFKDLTPEDLDAVKNLPRHVKVSMAHDKSQPDRGPWRINLLEYVYESFMELCPRRDLRHFVWRGRHLLSTHLTADVRYTTFEIIDDIRTRRLDIAKILGFDHYSHMSMDTKMAGSVDTVLTMLDTYKKFYLPAATSEVESLMQYGRGRGLISELQPWDIPFYRCLQSEYLHKSNPIHKAPYFILDNVLRSLFTVCSRLFDIKIIQQTEGKYDVWSKDVMVFNIYDSDDSYISTFYLDPFYRRETKVIKNSAESGRDRCDQLGMTPISYMVLTLNRSPMPNIPPLMTYREVLTLFFEFGNCLQHMLTTAPYMELAGQRNIEWDAVHVTANLMRMIAQHPSVIHDMSDHYLTKKKMSDEQIDKLIKCENHMLAYDMCYQLYYSAFDLECHMDNEETYWRDIHSEMYKMFMPVPEHKEDWLFCSDATLWYGNQHAASYYSKIWSKMLAANVLEVFEEAGLENDKQVAKVGKRYRETFLSLGGAVDAMTVFRRFKGCNPSLDSLIKRDRKLLSQHVQEQ